MHIVDKGFNASLPIRHDEPNVVASGSAEAEVIWQRIGGCGVEVALVQYQILSGSQPGALENAMGPERF